jgi:hypothetical protein
MHAGKFERDECALEGFCFYPLWEAMAAIRID